LTRGVKTWYNKGMNRKKLSSSMEFALSFALVWDKLEIG
jgi:hypothetical protein